MDFNLKRGGQVPLTSRLWQTLGVFMGRTSFRHRNRLWMGLNHYLLSPIEVAKILGSGAFFLVALLGRELFKDAQFIFKASKHPALKVLTLPVWLALGIAGVGLAAVGLLGFGVARVSLGTLDQAAKVVINPLLAILETIAVSPIVTLVHLIFQVKQARETANMKLTYQQVPVLNDLDGSASYSSYQGLLQTQALQNLSSGTHYADSKVYAADSDVDDTFDSSVYGSNGSSRLFSQRIPELKSSGQPANQANQANQDIRNLRP